MIPHAWLNHAGSYRRGQAPVRYTCTQTQCNITVGCPQSLKGDLEVLRESTCVFQLQLTFTCKTFPISNSEIVFGGVPPVLLSCALQSPPASFFFLIPLASLYREARKVTASFHTVSDQNWSLGGITFHLPCFVWLFSAPSENSPRCGKGKKPFEHSKLPGRKKKPCEHTRVPQRCLHVRSKYTINNRLVLPIWVIGQASYPDTW